MDKTRKHNVYLGQAHSGWHSKGVNHSNWWTDNNPGLSQEQATTSHHQLTMQV